MQNNDLHIQSIEHRVRIAGHFCRFIAFSSLGSVLLYLYLGMFELSLITAFIGLLFTTLYFLNRNKYYKIVRSAIILTTALGIIAFSLFLGYKSGVYLYLFVAPSLIYLFFDLAEKLQIRIALLLYLSAYVTIYLARNCDYFKFISINERSIELIYLFNFCSSFLLCFGMVIFFATNSRHYIDRLKDNQNTLSEEIDLRKESENKLKLSVTHQQVLLSEVHHRVKNNLATILALINLEIINKSGKDPMKILEETKDRIYAMSLVHNLLNAKGENSAQNMTSFFNQLCSSIEDGYKTTKTVQMVQEVEPFQVGIETTIPVSLILNELITNAFKHAFNERENGVITVGARQNPNGGFCFYVHDNGIGMNEEFIKNGNTGMAIVTMLVDQIDGKLRFERNNGTKISIDVP